MTRITEENYAHIMQTDVEPALSAQREEGFFSARDGLRIHYEMYVSPTATGGVVISHGFTESAEKFREMAWRMLQQGWNVFVIDHRGHGRSDRQIMPEYLTHVENFADYVDDFETFSKNLYSSLNDDGCLLFSQEHPFVTATFGGKQHYNKDENGNAVSYTFSDYGKPGKRHTFWYVDGVEKYHRRFSDIINSLCMAGFVIDTVCEPLPMKSATKKIPSILVQEEIKPTFLIVKAKKIKF